MSKEFIIEFKNPFNFEGNEHKSVDLSGIENLTTGDLIKADGQFGEIGQFAVMNEMTTGYACIVASQASGKPVEFFQQLPAVEGVKLKRLVMGFFNS
ncbi:hypothetical protein [Psychrobacillus sp. FSL K6-1464]|uniref:hypothetical protein n=1 Tax=Psychrobacillus sp. FSL K6-1464 TaxID=2921545 RepID=UPI0030F8397F